MRSSRSTALLAILRKDLVLFSRDWLFLALTVFSIVMFVTLYYVLPAEPQSSFLLGAHAPGLEPVLERLAAAEESEDEAVVFYDSEESLIAGVEEGEVDVGLAFPEGLATSVRSGAGADVKVFTRPNIPPEFEAAVAAMAREIAYALTGNGLPITEPAEESAVLGPAAGPIPLREQLKPLYAFIVLMMESIALSALIASEVQNRTMTALLSTPARILDVLASKGLLGATIAFSEATVILLLIRGFGDQPAIVLAVLALGAVMVSGVAMVAGSAGKDLLGTMQIGMLMLIPLAIPAFAVLVPGTPATWVTLIPSYGIVNAIVQSTQYGAGWSELWPDLALLSGWVVLIAALGFVVLKRRVEVV